MSAPRAVPGPAMTEKDLERFVKDAAKTFGWARYHTHRSDFSPAGFPDETLVRGHQLIFAELKSEKGKLSPEQAAWITILGQVEVVRVRVWRPADCDTIATTLR
jgi:hypothetical protein